MYEQQIDTLQIGKHTFHVFVSPDDSGETPWGNDCVFDGVVSASPRNWTRRDKAPHERIIYQGRQHDAWLFDVKRYIAVAVSQGCTRKQAAEQLEASFKRLQAWCQDEWSYVVLEVRRVDADGEELEADYLGGMESDCKDYIGSTAREMAEAMACAADKVRAKAAYARRQESKERRYWAARDVATVQA